jgi:hypothetical protein
MKLGTDTGNLVSWAMGNSRGAEPEIGMGVTFFDWTDRHAGTIVDILPKGIIVVQKDKAIRTDKNGMSESQEYRYEPQPTATPQYYRKNKTGRWERGRFNEETGRWNSIKGEFLGVGYRDAYHDFSF